MKKYDLPCYFTRKSFYGKAVVIEHDNGEKELLSYNTIVCKLLPTGEFVRLWPGYSATTMRHVNAFLYHYGYSYGGKTWWDTVTVNTPILL